MEIPAPYTIGCSWEAKPSSLRKKGTQKSCFFPTQKGRPDLQVKSSSWDFCLCGLGGKGCQGGGCLATMVVAEVCWKTSRVGCCLQCLMGAASAGGESSGCCVWGSGNMGRCCCGWAAAGVPKSCSDPAAAAMPGSITAIQVFPADLYK